MPLKFMGTPIYMNGAEYYVPSLSYRDFKENYELLTAAAAPEMDGPAMFKFFEDRIPVIGKAIRRNYPDVTDEQLAEWLDMTTLPLMIQAVASGSGIKPVTSGE